LVVLYLFAFPLFGERIAQLKNKALDGDVHSQLQLGFVYSKGPRADWKEALYWMKKAARKEIPSACRYLGFAYLEGKGTAQNKNLARKWFEIGSKKGDTLSMLGLSECLGKQEDKIKSVAWLLLADELGEPRARWQLEQKIAALKAFEKKQAQEEVIKIKASLDQDTAKEPTPAFAKKKHQMILGDGGRYRGAIKNGFPHGFGERVSRDGGMYQGSFRNGKEEGFGTLFSSEGLIIYQGLWTNGNPIDSLPKPEREKSAK
jgi:hypothetical protein